MNKEALLKVANHLESDHLTLKNFNFRYINKGNITEENLCGTNGCAIHEFPHLFPDKFKFNLLPIHSKSGDFEATVVLIDNRLENIFYTACTFFDISEKEFDILFAPSQWEHENDNDEFEEISYDLNDPHEYVAIGNERLHRLFPSATKEQVAQHIRKFIELKEKN